MPNRIRTRRVPFGELGLLGPEPAATQIVEESTVERSDVLSVCEDGTESQRLEVKESVGEVVVEHEVPENVI